MQILILIGKAWRFFFFLLTHGGPGNDREVEILHQFTLLERIRIRS